MMQQFLRVGVLLLALIGLLLGAAGVLAQDALPGPLVAVVQADDVPTPEPPVVDEPPLVTGFTRTEVVIAGLLFLAVVLLSLFGGLVIVSLRQAYNAAPPWLGELLKDNLTRGLDELKHVTDQTPNQIDDALEARLRQMLEEAFQRAQQQAVITREQFPLG